MESRRRSNRRFKLDTSGATSAGAAFLSAHCRLDGRLQHASYIASWLEVLQRDKRAVFVAAAQAQKAADYLLEHAGLLAPENVSTPLREAA